MKTREEILSKYKSIPEQNLIHESSVIEAMEEYAVQSVDCACANAVMQMETLEAENRSHIDCINGKEYKIMELEQQTTLLAQKCSDYADQITQCEIDRANLVAMTLERDELDEQYKLAVVRFKDADKRCREMGTKNAECWDKINAHERTIERLESGLEEAVALLRKVYEDVNTDAINISFEGGVLSEKIKDYLGV